MVIDSELKDIELSVVVLCYRSGKSIVPLVAEIEKVVIELTDRYEIILVGNYIEGTEDETKVIVSKLALDNPNITAITKPKQGMMGWDMKEGLKIALGNFVCVIDGDGQFPASSIGRAYHIIKNNNLDLVKTYRGSRADGMYRKIISYTYNVLFSTLFPGLRAKDINSKPKIIKKEVLNKMQLESNDWFIDAEIMINARRMNLVLDEFAVEFREQKTRLSFVKFGAIIEFIKNLFIYRWREFFIK